MKRLEQKRLKIESLQTDTTEMKTDVKWIRSWLEKKWRTMTPEARALKHIIRNSTGGDCWTDFDVL